MSGSANHLLSGGRRLSKPALTAWWPLLLTLAIFLFYAATLAPTVLWGDDAYFQRTAFDGELRADGGGHWLWLQAARLIVRLPLGDVAYRVNLLSAVAAAGTLAIMYAAGEAAGLGLVGATSTVVTLAVAHTFWSHAVRAEVYTLFTLLMATQLWLWFSWRERRPWPLYVAAGLFGTTLLGHQMVMLMVPAFGLLIWRNRAWLDRRQWGYLLLCFAVGLLPFFAVIYQQIGAVRHVNLLTSLNLYLTNAGLEFGSRMFDFSADTLPRDVTLWLGFWGLQFVGIAALLGLAGGLAAWNAGMPTPWRALVLLYITTVVFAISYRVNDHYVFFLPSYVAFSFFIGYGAQEILNRFKGRRRRVVPALLVALLFITPVITYRALASAMEAVDANPLNIRRLPGREPNRFFVWPAKNGYSGAANYALNALDSLPPDGIIIADHAPFETLRYFQSVAGVRPDVHLVQIRPGADLAKAVAEIPGEYAWFLADDNPAYYNLQNLPQARLHRVGDIYQLTLSR